MGPSDLWNIWSEWWGDTEDNEDNDNENERTPWKSDPSDLWPLRRWSHFWQLRTTTITFTVTLHFRGQYSQFLQCFFLKRICWQIFLGTLQICWRWYADVNSCGIVEKLFQNSLRRGGGGLFEEFLKSSRPLLPNNTSSASVTCFHFHNDQFQTGSRASQFLSKNCTISLPIIVPEHFPVGYIHAWKLAS